MEHEQLMNHAVQLATAFIQNGDLRHDGNFQDDGSSMAHDKVSLLVIQMYRAVAEASFETLQASWTSRRKGDLSDPSGSA